MKYLKNNLMKANSVISLCVILIFAANAFGQRDLSALITSTENIKLFRNNTEIPAGCREYVLHLTTGDFEPSGFGKIYATINGSNGSTGKIEISGGAFQRYNDSNPTNKSCVVNGDATTFVQWNSRFFTKNTGTAIFINSLDVGDIDSVTIEHTDLNPQWLLAKIYFESGGTTLINSVVFRWFIPGTLKQTFRVNDNPDLANYQINVKTGDVYQGGTDSKIYVSMNGKDGVIPKFELNKFVFLNNRPFDRNGFAQAEIYDQPVLSKNSSGQEAAVPSITITLDSGYWFLKSIVIKSEKHCVRVASTGCQYGAAEEFFYNRWIEGGKPVTIYPTTSENPTYTYRRITFRNEAGYLAKMMVQYFVDGPQGMQLPRTAYTADMPVGWNSVIDIPANAKNAKVFLTGVATLNNDFYVSNFTGYLAGDTCFKAWGTLFSPQGGTCDGQPVATNSSPEVNRTNVAEDEQSCLKEIQELKKKPEFKDFLGDNDANRLCRGGSTSHVVRVYCYGTRVKEISQENAIEECSGRIPLNSSPKIKTSVSSSNRFQTPPPAPTVAQKEQDCFNQVQGNVAYDTAGNKTWNENNIKSLCRGTTSPSATISCFSSKMPQMGWAKATQECAASNISSQTQRDNQMPVPSQNQRTSSGLSLEGSWEMYNDKGVKFDKNAKISQSGSNLSINNGYGANSTAVLNGNSLTTSDGLSGTISPDGTKINWTINYVWVKQVSAPANNPNLVTSPTSNSAVQTASSFGTARDIDAKNGAVWIIGTDAVDNEFGIYHLTGSSWTKVDGGARRVAVDNTGVPWVITSIGMIFRRENNSWKVIPGPSGATPLDIAISNSGEVWIVSDNGTVSRWTGSGWTNLIAISARKVIFTPNPDTFQIVDQNGKRFVRESGTSWIAAADTSGMADKYIEFAVDGETKWGIDSSFNIQRLGGGQSQGNYVVNETQVQPVSQITNTPTPTKRSITFRNEAGFVAKMMIQYFEAGPNGMSIPKFLFTENLPVGQSKTLEIPNSVPNTLVTVSLIGSGTTKDNFFSTNVEVAFNGNRCFKAWGTLFSPQGGTCQ